MTTRPYILLVDDDPTTRAWLVPALEAVLGPVQIEQVAGRSRFERALHAGAHDLVITEARLPWSSGLAVLETVRRAEPTCPVVILSSAGDVPTVAAAMKAGADDYVNKDASDRHRLPEAVVEALQRRRERPDRLAPADRHHQLFESVPIGLWQCDTDGRLVDVNPAFAEMCQSTSASDLIGRSWRDLFYRPRPLEQFEQALRDQQIITRFDAPLSCPTGERFWARLDARRYRVAPSGPLIWEGSLIDLTDRRRLECALRRSRARLRRLNEALERRVHERTGQLRSLTHELIHTEQRERRHLAQRLHDDLAQILAVCSMRLSSLAGSFELQEPERDALGEVQRDLNESIRFTRGLMNELSPLTLQTFGLRPALDTLARQIGQRHGLQVTVTGDYPACADETMCIVMFHAVRELLMNVVKHAHVTHASVQVTETGRHITIRVSDRGTGFDPRRVGATDFTRHAGFGLLGLRERLNMLQGQMSIDARPGQGTTVTLTLPLNAERLDVA